MVAATELNRTMAGNVLRVKRCIGQNRQKLIQNRKMNMRLKDFRNEQENQLCQ